MNLPSPKAIALFATLFVTGIGEASIAAEFEKSDDRLFLGGLDLAVEYEPGSEFGAYAIAQTGGENLPVIYVLFSDFKGQLATLGVFRCDKKFKVLESHSRGMRDISCVRQDGFGQLTSTTLRLGENGLYQEIF